jgi:VanZ family protein
MAIRGPASERALKTATAWLLSLTVLFMLYASLYPFDFDLARLAASGHEVLQHSLTWRRPPRTDMIANLLFYLPFGALVLSLTPARWGRTRRVLFTFGAGLLLSVLIECAQATTVSRDPSITDVAFNAVSAGIAALIALFARGLGLQAALPELRTDRPDVVAVLIVGLWIASHAAPFMPTTRFILYFTQPGRALDWHWSSGAFAGYLAGYVLVGAALRSLLRPRSFWQLFLPIAVVSLVARIVFRGQRLELMEVVAFIVALPSIWHMARSAERAGEHQHSLAAARIALLWAAPAFVFFSLAPFDFSVGAQDFAWLTWPPLTARLSAGEPGLLEVGFFYTAAVWLLREAQLPLRRILVGMLTTSLLIEVIQAWEPGRAAQLAATLVVLVATTLVWARDRVGVTARQTVASE